MKKLICLFIGHDWFVPGPFYLYRCDRCGYTP